MLMVDASTQVHYHQTRHRKTKRQITANKNMKKKWYRQALRYIIRNTTLPPRVRATAQLQLTQMHCYTNPTQIRNRCILGGKGRGIMRDFKLSRVSLCVIIIITLFKIRGGIVERTWGGRGEKVALTLFAC